MTGTATAHKIRVIRSEALQAGPPTYGMERHMAVLEDFAVVELRIAPHVVPGWHHHGTRTIYVFVQAGTLRIEFGVGGRETIEVKAGDWYTIPPETVHRESNLGDEDLVIVGLATGTGPTVVNVDGPDKG